MLIKNIIYARCDDCDFTCIFISIEDMKNNGWVISRNRLNCYCTNCASFHRHVGRNGVSKTRIVENVYDHSEK